MSSNAEELIADVLPLVESALNGLDELAELWGDEGKFRRMRDKLREAVAKLKESPHAH